MKKIIVASDLHGSYSAWKKAEKYVLESDLILISGDILYHGARNPLTDGYNTSELSQELNDSDYNIMMVKGNVDSLVDDWVLPYPLPEYALIDRDGLRIVMYHGHQHKSEEERIEFAKRFSADILIFGHTHKPTLKKEKGVILLNPGSLSLPKQKPPVASIAEIEDGEIKIRELDTGDIISSMEVSNE